MLANKVALVTGAAAGLGRAITQTLFEYGCSVFATDCDGAAVAALVAELNATNTGRDAAGAGAGAPRAVAHALDVSSEPQWAAAVAACAAAFGRIDILVCNAGINILAELEQTTLDVWTRTMNVNALGTLLAMRAVVPHMKAQGSGCVVSVASMGALRGTVAQSAYCASKGAVRLLCKSLALELIPHGIRVNLVHPGTCATPMGKRLAVLTRQRPEDLGKVSPIARLASPREIAEVVAFIASDRASYMVGAEVSVDGGSTVGFTGASPVPAPSAVQRRSTAASHL